ncbi:MAG TPA: VacJ family lipoprotein [Casimicrobiaceae bacterium]|jgi:phospholipid-binding lipoprotein MlaA
MIRRALRVCGIVALLGLAGCATVQTTSKDDPFEPWNRAMYDVHQVVDGHFFKPIAQAYVDWTPRLMQQGIHNFFQNLDDVVSIVNDWLQWDLNRAGNDTGRVMINSFFGIGGLIDIASEAGIERGNQDFGLTFGKWGIPQGPYLFVPVIGPTTVRDGTGLIVRAYASPLSYVIVDVPTRNILYGVGFVDYRAQALEAEKLVDQAAIDRYTFIRRAYLQRRAYLVRDGRPAPPEEED